MSGLACTPIDYRTEDGFDPPGMSKGSSKLHQVYPSGFSNVKRRMRWHGLAAANGELYFQGLH